MKECHETDLILQLGDNMLPDLLSVTKILMGFSSLTLITMAAGWIIEHPCYFIAIVKSHNVMGYLLL